MRRELRNVMTKLANKYYCQKIVVMDFRNYEKITETITRHSYDGYSDEYGYICSRDVFEELLPHLPELKGEKYLDVKEWLDDDGLKIRQKWLENR